MIWIVPCSLNSPLSPPPPPPHPLRVLFICGSYLHSSLCNTAGESGLSRTVVAFCYQHVAGIAKGYCRGVGHFLSCPPGKSVHCRFNLFHDVDVLAGIYTPPHPTPCPALSSSGVDSSFVALLFQSPYCQQWRHCVLCSYLYKAVKEVHQLAFNPFVVITEFIINNMDVDVT